MCWLLLLLLFIAIVVVLVVHVSFYVTFVWEWNSIHWRQKKNWKKSSNNKKSDEQIKKKEFYVFKFRSLSSFGWIYLIFLCYMLRIELARSILFCYGCDILLLFLAWNKSACMLIFFLLSILFWCAVLCWIFCLCICVCLNTICYASYW